MAHPTRRQALLAAFAGAGLTLALSGCQSAVKLAEAGGTAASPVAGGTLTIAQSADIQPNNVLAGRLGNSSWAANVYETLTTYDAESTPQPVLATEWTLAADELSIDITLRDDVTFHSGRAMTAEDVKFSLEQVGASTSQVGFITKAFESVEVTSPTSLTIRFTRPIPNLFDLFEYAFILDSETIAGVADGSQVIGTGPFRFESWSPGSETRLIRNDTYWGERPYLDAIEIAVIADSTAMLNAVRSFRSQVAIGMNPIDVQALGTNPAFSVENISGSVYPFGIDVTQAPFDTKEARQAVNYAIDRERIAVQLFGDAGVVTPLFWEPTTPGYPTDLNGAYPYDPAKARQMLADAGAAGAELTITVISLPENTSVAEIVRNNLEEVGLRPTIKIEENQSFGERQIAGDLGPAFMPLHGLNGLSPMTLMNTLPSLREGNSSNFWTEEYAALRQALVQAPEGAEQEAALRALSEYILDQAFTAGIVQSVGQNVIAASAHDVRFSTRAYMDARYAFVDQN